MTARLRKFASDLGETFWVLPGLMVMAGILAAVGSVHLDRIGVAPRWLIAGPRLYDGATGSTRRCYGDGDVSRKAVGVIAVT